MTEQEKLLESLDKVNRLLRRGKRHFHRGGYRLLRFISQHEEISTKELSEKLGMRVASINERLLRYEEEQLIERYRSKSDKRIFNNRITDLGKEKLEQLKQKRVEAQRKVKINLTKQEMTDLTALLNKLSSGLESEEMD